MKKSLFLLLIAVSLCSVSPAKALPPALALPIMGLLQLKAAQLASTAAGTAAIKLFLVGGSVYGLQYLSDSLKWVRLIAVHTNTPIKIIDTLGWAGEVPVVGVPFEFARTLLLNYWFAT